MAEQFDAIFKAIPQQPQQILLTTLSWKPQPKTKISLIFEYFQMIMKKRAINFIILQ
jgi:hypothetical protein